MSIEIGAVPGVKVVEELRRGRMVLIPEFVPPYKYERETKAKYAERTEWLHKIWETVEPGDTITTVLRHRSSSGMYRAIDLYLMSCEGGEPGRQWLSYWTAHAGVGRWDDKREAVGTSGAGMDMGFHLVYTLSSMLYPNGFVCVGDPDQTTRLRSKRCPSNDHSNGMREYGPTIAHRSGGYALSHEWL